MEPPIEPGAVNATVAVVVPVEVAVPIVGAPGAVVGVEVVTEFDADDASEAPIALVATTVNVYAVVALSPVIEIVPEPACVSIAVIDPGLEVAMYDVIVDPPSETGAVNETVAVVVPVEVAVLIVGASGTVADEEVVMELEADDAVELPTALVATTVNV